MPDRPAPTANDDVAMVGGDADALARAPRPRGEAEPGPPMGTHGRLVALARVVSVAEAVSFLLLLVATAVKYGADEPVGVRVLGPLHGGLFLAYCALVVAVAAVRRWPVVRTLLAVGASVLPVAPLLVERAWLRGAGAGVPHLDPSGHPDASLPSRS